MWNKKISKDIQNKLLGAIKYFIVISGFVYLYYQLKSEIIELQDWQNLMPVFSGFNFLLMIGLLFSVAFNWFLEALKWKIISPSNQGLQMYTALKQVLMALSAGIVTPYRSGDIVARSFFFPSEVRLQAALAALLNSFVQFWVTVLMGYFFLFKLPIVYSLMENNILHVTLFLFFFLLLMILIHVKWLQMQHKVKDGSFAVKKRQVFLLWFLSFLRYFVFVVQYYIVFQLFQISLGFYQIFSQMAVFFLLLYLLPAIQIADFGLRGSIGAFIFSFADVSAIQIAFMFFLIWFLAVFVPATLGYYYLSRQKINS